MKKVFIDTNILLDVFLNRESFVEPAAALFADCESGKVKGIVSAVSLNNVHYILSRHIGKNKALEAVRIVLNVFTVAALDEIYCALPPICRTRISRMRSSSIPQSRPELPVSLHAMPIIFRKMKFRFCHPPIIWR